MLLLLFVCKELKLFIAKYLAKTCTHALKRTTADSSSPRRKLCRTASARTLVSLTSDLKKKEVMAGGRLTRHLRGKRGKAGGTMHLEFAAKSCRM